MPTTKKGKLKVKTHQVNGTEWVHTLWPLKLCPKAGLNMFSLTCKLLQGKKIVSDQQNNIIVSTPKGNIIFDHQINTHDRWVTGVDFFCEADNERAVSATALPKKNVNNLHVELGHPSEAITQSTT